MARPLRIQFPAAVYHVMNRGTARQAVFREPNDYETFLQVVADCHGQWGVDVFAYCLMGNHYHLCLRTPEGNLSRVMRHLDGLYTQRFNRAHARDGPLFRGRYKALLVEADAYLAAVIRYIHLNPVAAKLVRRPEAYRWSSHGAYVGRQARPIWLAMREVLAEFPSRAAFHEFVLAGNDAALEEFYRAGRQFPVLGSERFRERLRARDGAVSREHPRHERQVRRPAVETVLRGVARGYGVPVGELRAGRRGHPSEPRKVAMYLVRKLCDLTLREAAAHFGVSNYGTVGWACHQMRNGLQTSGPLRRRLQGIERVICQPKT